MTKNVFLRVRAWLLGFFRDKRVSYPVMFLLVNLCCLLVEYFLLGPHYSSLSGVNAYGALLRSNRVFLIAAISVYLSAFISMLIVCLKTGLFFVRRLHTAKKELLFREDIWSWLVFGIMFLMIAFGLFFGFLSFTADLSLWSKMWIFVIFAINTLFITGLYKNIQAFFVSLYTILGVVVVVLPLSALFSWSTEMINDYIAAALILVLQIIIYGYIHQTIPYEG